MLWSRRRRVPAREPRVPVGTRVYAVGDIHGRQDLLIRLLEAIREDAASDPPDRRVLVYIGDYVDRGLESKAVIDLLLGDPMPGFESVFLKGNHEDWLLRFLADPAVGHEWLPHGGLATLLSYGVVLPEGGSHHQLLRHARESLGCALPATHRAFLEALSLSHSEGDYLFVHAGIRPGIPVEAQDEQDLLWIRDPFISDGSDHGVVVVHGHSVSDAPEVLRNRIGIDTGAYATGRLACLVLEGAGRRFIST